MQESNFVVHKMVTWVIGLYISKNDMFLPSAKEYERIRLSCKAKSGHE